MEPMLVEPMGDTAAVETILQLTHAVVVERRALGRLSHGRL
jgi:hypothetical protein